MIYLVCSDLRYVVCNCYLYFRKKKKKNNHIYQKSFYLSDGNFHSAFSRAISMILFFIYMDSNLMQTLEKYYIPKTIIYLF